MYLRSAAWLVKPKQSSHNFRSKLAANHGRIDAFSDIYGGNQKAIWNLNRVGVYAATHCAAEGVGCLTG